ncbi:hypothetical protein LCI18_007619 [Fusarium solani-melongenae]|uniref:Uncharacterized protein n=1 Tax=Fusarium solani subsp. cucurbitae TaxID=2747967 RepID=A0ACD3Z5Y8_FUSSC|nr:hypothetical protein LCI18_007619 [Fusarium solani-melongenae]
MASAVNTSIIDHPPSISSNTRSLSPDTTNPSQPRDPSDNTPFSHMGPDPTAPVAARDDDIDLSINTNRRLIRPRVTVPDISPVEPTPKS